MNRFVENNQVTISGEIISEFRYNHEVFGEKFYLVDVRVKRLSGSYDVIPVMVSDRLVDVSYDCRGMLVSISGQFRSYNHHDENKNRLILTVFVRDMEFLEELGAGPETNQIYLEGYICKDPIHRKTPLGREIADVLLAVNRPYGKSDYIPCICWGRNARFAGNFQVGQRCAVWGRVQSREYIKKISDEQVENRVAYEVSVSKLEVLDDEK